VTRAHAGPYRRDEGVSAASAHYCLIYRGGLARGGLPAAGSYMSSRPQSVELMLVLQPLITDAASNDKCVQRKAELGEKRAGGTAG
jgi:hypothetical protein